MAEQPRPTAPGHALNRYLQDCQDALDHFKQGQLSWAELMDIRQQANARLDGQLVDHFLVRAHNVRHLSARAKNPSSATGR